MASPTPGQTNLGLAPNVGGLLCYAPCCIGLVFSIVAAIVEKQSRFLRFHAFQSLLFHGAMVVLWVAIWIFIAILGFIAGALAFIAQMFTILIAAAVFAAQIFLMVKAYGNEEFELPTIGPMARQWV
jgi:uncharacterized membrane protein